MRFTSHKAVVMRPLLSALASSSLIFQLRVSGDAVSPAYRKPDTVLRKSRRHGVDASLPPSALRDPVSGSQAGKAVPRGTLIGYGMNCWALFR